METPAAVPDEPERMNRKRAAVSVSEKESVSAVISLPGNFRAQTALITAHGAGNDMNNPLLITLCDRLALAGILGVRFNFPYKEFHRKAPDKPEILRRTWLSIVRFVEKSEYHPRDIFVGGKSMGGRIASEMAAAGYFNASGLVFLGYPLHPPGRKDMIRADHLRLIEASMLFFAGTRDSLCDINLLKKVIASLKGAQLEIIENADHSFNLPKSSPVTQADVFNLIADRTIEWIKAETNNL